jgi:hypothetical protein
MEYVGWCGYASWGSGRPECGDWAGAGVVDPNNERTRSVLPDRRKGMAGGIEGLRRLMLTWGLTWWEARW